MSTQNISRARGWRHGLCGVLGALALAALAASCGGDTGGGPCSGTGCSCAATGDCVCNGGPDCKANCGAEGCVLNCTAGAKCNATSTGPVKIVCDDTSD